MDRLQELMPEFWAAALETLYMTSFALVLGGVLGLLIGVILYVTRPGGLLPNRAVSMLANLAVNIPGPTFLSGKKLQGSSLGSTRSPIDMPRLVQMYLDGVLDLDTMVAERIGLADVNDALEKLRKGDSARSVIVFP